LNDDDEKLKLNGKKREKKMEITKIKCIQKATTLCKRDEEKKKVNFKHSKR
jgi:hypothetical protein